MRTILSFLPLCVVGGAIVASLGAGGWSLTLQKDVNHCVQATIESMSLSRGLSSREQEQISTAACEDAKQKAEGTNDALRDLGKMPTLQSNRPSIRATPLA